MSTGGAKRGRKPRGALTANSTAGTPRPVSQDPAPSASVPTPVQWASQTMNLISTTSTGTTPNISSITSTFQSNMTATATTASATTALATAATTTTSITSGSLYSGPLASPAMHSLQTGSTASTPPIKTSSIALPGSSTTPIIPGTSTSTLTSILANAGTSAITGAGITSLRPTAVEEDADGEDELLPAMADDDYSAQLSWQSQSKDNLKVLTENLSPAQYDRFEAYRRHALPKQAVRKLIQQSLGLQVSQPIAQIVAGFGKVFVGEIVEKARAVQAQRGETGPLSPDHLREAYRMQQLETGRVGAARPLRAKRLFVR